MINTKMSRPHANLPWTGSDSLAKEKTAHEAAETQGILIAVTAAAGLTLAVAPSALAAPAAHAAATAPDSGLVSKVPAAPSTVTVCSHANTAYCADVRGNSNTAGTAIWLQHNGADDKWIMVTRLCSRVGIYCVAIEDAQKPTLCLSDTGTAGSHIALETCGDKGSWYNQGGYILGNGWYGEAGDMDTQAVGNGYFLYGADSLDGGKYLTWNAPGIN
jgi:hypothetical protein